MPFNEFHLFKAHPIQKLNLYGFGLACHPLSKDSQSQKTPKLVQEPRSSENLCEQLNKLVKQPEWNIETANRFINLIINSERQFQLEIQQQDSVVTAIINCPLKYRAIVHLAIVSANFTVAVLSNVKNRIEHELNKLERCLSGSYDSFQENSKIGLTIIKKIREQLTD